MRLIQRSNSLFSQTSKKKINPPGTILTGEKEEEIKPRDTGSHPAQRSQK